MKSKLKEFFRLSKRKVLFSLGLIAVAIIVMVMRENIPPIIINIFWPIVNVPGAGETRNVFWTYMLIEIVYLYLVICVIDITYNKIDLKSKKTLVFSALFLKQILQ